MNRMNLTCPFVRPPPPLPSFFCVCVFVLGVCVCSVGCIFGDRKYIKGFLDFDSWGWMLQKRGLS